MPYIDKYQRPLLEELVRNARQYPSWKNPKEHAILMGMIYSWINMKGDENPLRIDGYVNFVCTFMLKHTHQTYHTLDEHKTKILNSVDKEAATFVRDLFSIMFESGLRRGYSSYERLYGLLCLMEYEFERRGWSTGRKDLKDFFHNEKLYWRKRIAEYEDEKMQQNGDVD